MRKRQQGSAKTQQPLEGQSSQPGLGVKELSRYITEFLYECECRGHSSGTLQEEKSVLGKLVRYLEETEATYCGVTEIRQFLIHVRAGGMQRGGRWSQQKKQEVRPRTVRNYYGYLRTFFNWLQTDYEIDSPVDRVKTPIVRSDQIQPFTKEHIEALRRASKHTSNHLRDEAIVLFLLDCGVRASELCTIRNRDLDLSGHCCTVLGKGNKRRTVRFGIDTKKALWRYIQDSNKSKDDYLFTSVRGTLAGEPLTRAGLLQLIERLGKTAGVQGVRCSPHTFRHTFAICFLNNGGNVFSLKELLGHTDLAMTQRYVNLSHADLESQVRRFSPVDSLKTNAKKGRET